MTREGSAAPRCAALVGPYLSGKTTLLEAMLHACGAIQRKGKTADGNTVGDSSAEARARSMSTEVSVADARFLDDRWSFIDCPGSFEFTQETRNALLVADVAVVVCEPAIERVSALAPLFHYLDEYDIPHMLFINKMDSANVRVRDMMEALQAVSKQPLVLRQVPIRESDKVTGYVDLVSERAYQYRHGEASALIELPPAVQDREHEARQELLETVADFDDSLLEQLLEDIEPDKSAVYKNLAANLREDRLVPVFLGSAEHDGGVRRLLKALRHETPGVEHTRARYGIEDGGELLAQVFKTIYAGHTGKLSYARIWRGALKDGTTLGDERASGLFSLFGGKHDKIGEAPEGAVVAIGRMDKVQTGAALSPSGKAAGVEWPAAIPPVFASAIVTENRGDEVKLSGAIHKLIEEDPALQVEHNAGTHEMVLWGQGDVHLAVAADRLAHRFNVAVSRSRPQVAYQETIRKAVQQHARHKKQSGGHGQFGDVHIEVKPVARGEGFQFLDEITGGAIPRQFIPSVEHGVKEYLSRGPLGFPVVDIAVRLYDGQFHTVDSSDQAFRAAGQLAMREAMPNASPVLLEPIYKVSIDVPSDHTSKINNLITGKRGQILGFDAKQGWAGWDTVECMMPQAELRDLIIELRSVTQGSGTFRFSFDHMAELTGRLADQVVDERTAIAAQ
ncbi:MAG: elongation factor G [Alphaproteobacteria bacterium]